MSFLRFSSLQYRVLNCSKTETLLKAGYFDIIYKFYHEISYHWKALKIMIRYKYEPKDVGMYMDYLVLLAEDNRDLSNPIYVCPKNLKKEHDKYLLKANKREIKKD